MNDEDKNFIVERISELRNVDKRNRSKLVHDFNLDLFWIVNLCLKRRPSDSNVYRLKSIMSTAKSYDHEVLIIEAGPYILAHRKDLANSKSLPTKKMMEEEITKRTQKESNKQFAIELFNLATEELNKMVAEEKDMIYEKIKSLLDSYLLFCTKEGIEEKQ